MTTENAKKRGWPRILLATAIALAMALIGGWVLLQNWALSENAKECRGDARCLCANGIAGEEVWKGADLNDRRVRERINDEAKRRCR